jgi:DMSO/TMAO reductase YedYZ molybdopterin-dependent catalytic subunit
LTPEWCAPLRLRIPTKLGFKSAKNLQSIEVTNRYSAGFWENQGYNWFSGSQSGQLHATISAMAFAIWRAGALASVSC